MLNPTPPAKGEDDAEILVHIAAPARSVDDRHYRALATAYLNFQPDTRVCQVIRKVGLDRNGEEPSQVTPTREASIPSSPDSSELSFSGAWGNPESPRLAATAAHQPPVDHQASQASNGSVSPAESSQQQSTQQDSLVPPSEVPDSMPFNHCGIQSLVSPSRLIEHFMGPPAPPSRLVHLPPLGAIVARSPIAVSQIDPIIIPATPSGEESIIPDTQLPEAENDEPHANPDDTAPEAGHGHSGSDADIVEDTTLEGGSATTGKRPATTTVSRADSEPIHSKRPRLSSDDPSRGPPTRSMSESGANDDHATTHPLVLKNTDTKYLSLLEVDAPGPPTGMDVILPASLITPNLSVLANLLQMSRRFRPVETRRDLRPFERGYWLVDCSGWDGDMVRQAWGFLYNYVSQGLAGWGCRCVRDENWQWMRLWCFGHVVGHTYLLLYLASERKLKTERAQWIDGEGLVVLVTEGHA